MSNIIHMCQIKFCLWRCQRNIPYILSTHNQTAIFLCFSSTTIQSYNLWFKFIDCLLYSVIPYCITSKIKRFISLSRKHDNPRLTTILISIMLRRNPGYFYITHFQSGQRKHSNSRKSGFFQYSGIFFILTIFKKEKKHSLPQPYSCCILKL